MLVLYFDHQEQMMSVVDVTSASERKMNITISQKNSIKTKNIHEKLNKLQVLYELNECRNNELMLWESMHEESAEEIKKDNEQTWKEVHEEKETCWQLSEESEREVDDVVWKLSCSQRQRCIISAKLLWEIQD